MTHPILLQIGFVLDIPRFVQPSQYPVENAEELAGGVGSATVMIPV